MTFPLKDKTKQKFARNASLYIIYLEEQLCIKITL